MKRLAPPIEKATPVYRQLWRIVDGAIQDAFKQHPNYLAGHGRLFDNARRSIAKRVTGAVLGYAEQSARGRSGFSPAAGTDEAVISGQVHVSPGKGGADGSRRSEPVHRCDGGDLGAAPLAAPITLSAYQDGTRDGV